MHLLLLHYIFVVVAVDINDREEKFHTKCIFAAKRLFYFILKPHAHLCAYQTVDCLMFLLLCIDNCRKKRKIFHFLVSLIFSDHLDVNTDDPNRYFFKTTINHYLSYAIFIFSLVLCLPYEGDKIQFLNAFL